jgi:hypothetical protein
MACRVRLPAACLPAGRRQAGRDAKTALSTMPQPVKVRVFFHDRCFDGAASAAVFTRFFRERINSAAEFFYTGMTHQAKRPFNESMFDGDENAIVDFKYSSSPRVTWWFDHHQSAFLTPADAEHFKNDRANHKFYDPSYKSCTKLIADVAQSKFGFDPRPLADLIQWGDVIDGAQYASPEAAVSISEPATQLALVIEAAPGESLSATLIPELATRPLAEIVKMPIVARHLGPLLERHRRSIEIFKQRIEASGGVIFFDLSDLDAEGYNKFIPYLLHPECVYSVGVTASTSRAKISLGSNPWRADQVNKNLAALAERFGGGGHTKVAAISLDPGDIARARQVAHEIAAELRG